MRSAAALVLSLPFLVAAAPGPGQPQEKTPLDGGHYSMLPAPDGGFVRLDGTTGAMSLCKIVKGDLDCRLGADERAAMQAEIDRLAGINDRLTARLAALGEDPSDPGIGTLARRELERLDRLFTDFVRRLVITVHALIPHPQTLPDSSAPAGPPAAKDRPTRAD